MLGYRHCFCRACCPDSQSDSCSLALEGPKTQLKKPNGKPPAFPVQILLSCCHRGNFLFVTHCYANDLLNSCWQSVFYSCFTQTTRPNPFAQTHQNVSQSPGGSRIAFWLRGFVPGAPRLSFASSSEQYPGCWVSSVATQPLPLASPTREGSQRQLSRLQTRSCRGRRGLSAPSAADQARG